MAILPTGMGEGTQVLICTGYETGKDLSFVEGPTKHSLANNQIPKAVRPYRQTHPLNGVPVSKHDDNTFAECV